MRHYTAMLFLSLCWLGITVSACVLAIGVKRELQHGIRCWRVRRELHSVHGLRIEKGWRR